MYHHQSANNDVVAEILLRLPVQSLLRLRTICKLWCNIIDSSTFRKWYLQNQANNNKGDDTLFIQFIYGNESLWELPMTFLDKDGKSYKDFPDFHKFYKDNIGTGSIGIGGSIEGLICIYLTLPDPYSKNVHEWSPLIALSNPSLGKTKTLPISPMCSTYKDKYGYCCTHAIKYREIGFSFDSISKDYKVVQVLKFWEVDDCEVHSVEVYSRRTNTWKDLGTNNIDPDLFIEKAIKSWYKNGALGSVHWLAYRRAQRGGGYYEDLILTFDVHNEVFETILIPNGVAGDEKFEVFAKDGSFVLFVYSNLVLEDCWLKVWELRDRSEGGEWCRVTSIGPFDEPARPIALWKSGGGVVIRCNVERKLIFYDYCTLEVGLCFEAPDVERLEILEYECSLISP